jgi:hypothetical protein
MKDAKPHAALARALALSLEVLAAAEAGNLHTLAALDAERLRLLKLFRLDVEQRQTGDSAVLHEIGQLNDRTIGLLEHQKRRKGREMDMAAVGRRAVAAYSSVRLQR